MGKKFDISSKEFTKLLGTIQYAPHDNIVKLIDKKMFPLDQNKIYSYKPEYLAFKEYNRCLSLFIKRNPGLKPTESVNRIFGVQKLIISAEEPHIKALEKLGIETIKEIYQVPDYVDLKAFIQPRLSLDTDQDSNPETFLSLTLEEKNQMRDEIQKRVLLNGLVHGSSMHVWTGVYHMVSSELNNINPNLKELYDYYTSSLGLYLWYCNPAVQTDSIEHNSQITQGLNRLKFNKQKGFGGQVEAKGINFATLIHELNKGVLDWLISAGIPQDYTEAQLTYYYSKADNYHNEFWHYLLSPTLWVDLLDTAQVSNENIPKLISKLTKLSYPELVQLFRLIQDDPEQATQKIKAWNLN